MTREMEELTHEAGQILSPPKNADQISVPTLNRRQILIPPAP